VVRCSVNAEDENEAREKLKNDSWLQKGILELESVTRWEIFIDARWPACGLARSA
jgi:hypothetical protein